MQQIKAFCFILFTKSAFSHKDIAAHHRVGFSYYVDNDNSEVAVSLDLSSGPKVAYFYIKHIATLMKKCREMAPEQFCFETVFNADYFWL